MNTGKVLKKAKEVAIKKQYRFHWRECVYPSNLLTLLRLLLLVPTLRYMRQPDTRWHALACFHLAMLTDALDGPLARRRGEVSQLGEIIDPIADKLLIDGTALMLVHSRGFPRWMVGLLLLRDVGILLSALLVLRHKARITPARLAGKASTVAMTATLIVYMADGPRTGKPALYVALVPFGLSFVQYGHQFVRFMRHKEQEPE
jgi:CDP-diacylglycerol--glycerol-3-phosphate 3-phosphatidyltransferase